MIQEQALVVGAGAVPLLVGPDGHPVSSTPAPPELTPEQREALERDVAVRRRIAGGETVYAADGVGYVVAAKQDGTPIVTWDTLTLRRAIPKIRGKAARKTLKRERQRLANRTLRRQGELEARTAPVVDWQP